MASKTLLSTAAVAVLALAGGTAWWLQARAQAPAASTAATAPATLVTLATAQQQDVPVTVSVNGSVVSLNSVDVRPQVSNVVTRVHVKEGETVRAGQLLFSLDARADRANLEKARAQVQKDEATLADLERQFRRSQDLLAQNFIARSATDTVQSQVESQRAAVAADRAAVQAAAVALGYDEIRSPVAGRTGAIPVFAGTLVQPATPLVTVTQLDPIAVSFPVPEGQLQDLLQAARRRAPVQAVVPGRAAPLQGVLSFVDNTVDPQVGTVRAKAEFANPDQALWPGQYVNTRVTVRVLHGAIVVPVAALITGPAGRIVYVVKDGTAQPRKVELDYTAEDRAVVRGLQPGESVVLEGKQNLRAGARVRVERAPAAAPAGRASTPPRKDPA
ncbi:MULTISPECIES: efflux RND transporter periplasmic adaptor subunit [Ramlibacter]|uniref:Efflux RND transporter periplasmic adaptor subunit n=1 Tax=Ramlibacter aquaticus TaxID=2780094 RepID=A0ABR9SCU6_9BURK|nr:MULTISPECIES: efflux RND transporter periplasmic adaptor subunit [Ramlibacter]MBE7940181.1 efflux RND transporter periplasmic adaptor subunit [Ramlibacter aquaticus]